MWEKFKQRLGKFVQGVKAIFRRRGNSANAQEKDLTWDSFSSSTETPVFKLAPMEDGTMTFTCDNTTINKDALDILCYSEEAYNRLFHPQELREAMEELVDECYDKKDIILDETGKVKLEWKKYLDEEDCRLLEEIMKELEISANGSRTNLPKRIPTKALIVSVAANQPYEYLATDLSQLEEKGIAHLIHGITESHQDRWEKDKAFASEEEMELVREYLEEHGNGELISSVIPNGTLLYWEDLDLWDYELPGC